MMKIVIDRCSICGAKLTDADMDAGLFETASSLLCRSCTDALKRCFKKERWRLKLSGRQTIEGEIIEEKENHIRFKTLYGELLIPRKKVLRAKIVGWIDKGINAADKGASLSEKVRDESRERNKKGLGNWIDRQLISSVKTVFADRIVSHLNRGISVKLMVFLPLVVFLVGLFVISLATYYPISSSPHKVVHIAKGSSSREESQPQVVPLKDKMVNLLELRKKIRDTPLTTEKPKREKKDSATDASEGLVNKTVPFTTIDDMERLESEDEIFLKGVDKASNPQKEAVQMPVRPLVPSSPPILPKEQEPKAREKDSPLLRKPQEEKNDQFQDKVEKAIEEGVKWLLSQQREDGSFVGGGYEGFPVGTTAISLYALLSSNKVKPDSKEVQEAFEYLGRLVKETKEESSFPGNTYEAALLILAVDAYFSRPLQKRLPDRWRTEVPKEFEKGPVLLRNLAEKAAKWLIKTQLSNGMWTYGGSVSGWMRRGDLSNTQFALLGLDAARRLGISVPSEVFTKNLITLVGMQQVKGEEYEKPFYVPAAEESLLKLRKQGYNKSAGRDTRRKTELAVEKMFVRGFGYTLDSSQAYPYLTMTAAGLAGLVVCKSVLEDMGSYSNYGKKCDSAIRDAAAYIAKNFSVRKSRDARGMLVGSGWGDYYHLFSLERAGVMAMVEKFGEHDWYREGAEAILEAQLRDGSWQKETVYTAFAILFLSRAVVAPADTIYTGGDVLPQKPKK